VVEVLSIAPSFYMDLSHGRSTTIVGTLNYHFSRDMASYERMPINGKLRSGRKSGDPTTLPPSTVARSAWATALQI